MDDEHAASVLRRIVQLERDRLFLFDAAIGGVKEDDLRRMLQEMRADHEANLGQLESAMRERAASPPETESLHGLRLESGVAAASIVGDDDVVERVAASELEAIDAYDQAVSDESLGEALRVRLRDQVEEERRHRQWMTEWLAVHEPSPPPDS